MGRDDVHRYHRTREEYFYSHALVGRDDNDTAIKILEQFLLTRPRGA